MPRHLEPFSGGLVTVRDPAVLAIGEMVQMQNAVYWPANMAPQRASGRAAFGAVAASAEPVRGLRDIKFDNGDHFLLAMASATLSTATVGDTGTFANVSTWNASGTALDAIHYNDEWFLFGGTNINTVSASGNLVAYLSATSPGQGMQIRPHGLTPNSVGITASTGAGTWTAGATGYFEYWFTELFSYTHDGVTSVLESTFSPGTGIPFTLFVSSTAMQASIYVPLAPTNSNAQKWRLYRAGPKALATDQLFPTGFKLVDGQFGTTDTVLDGSATTGAYVAANGTATTSPYATMVNPGNIFTSDNVYATHTGIAPGAVVATFATFSVTEPVVGITVSVEAKRSGTMGCSVAISNDSGVSWSSEKNIVLTASDVVLEVGSSSDLWGLNWTGAELVSGKFRVRVIMKGFTGGDQGFVDQVRAKITSAGTQPLDESTPFPAIIISAAGVDAAVGSHGQPPLATVGDIFQGTLVTNSKRRASNGVTEESFIRYSLPDQPDYFPDPYYLDFNFGRNEKVTNIKTLNNCLGVFLNEGHWRVKYLPTEADADFNRGICREEVSHQYGCVNEMCACLFEGQSGRTEIAFVSDKNIHATNLFSTRMLADDLDWTQIMTRGSSTAIALINNPEMEELLFYYKNTDSSQGDEQYKCLHLSYNEKHMRSGGRLKISGPVHMRNSVGGVFSDLYSAWTVRRSTGFTDVFLGYGGTAQGATSASAGYVLREQGTAIPAADSKMKLRTRTMYLAGQGNEGRLDNTFTYVASGNSAQTITITPYTVLTNDTSGLTAQTGQSRAWNGEKQFELAFIKEFEGLAIEIAQASNNQGHFGPQQIAVDWTSYGIEDSGK